MCKKEPGLHWLTVALAAAAMGLCASALAADAAPPIRVAAGDPQAADFLIVDNFESYTEDEGNRWYEFWYDSYVWPYPDWLPLLDILCEQRIVHSGGQSLALDYDNSYEPYYAGLARIWDIPMDWTINGLDTLVFYVHGQATSDSLPLYVRITDSAGKAFTAAYPYPEIIFGPGWLEWRIPLGDITRAGVNPKRIKEVCIGVGDRTSSKPGGSGRIYVDDIMVVRADSFPWLQGSQRSYSRDGDVNTPQSLVLSWSVGEGAAFHDIYFGQDANAVADASPTTAGIYQGRLAWDWNRFDPGPLDWGKTYFWRVDEVNDACPASPVKGEVWRFTTADFLVIDDFESYTDDVDACGQSGKPGSTACGPETARSSATCKRRTRPRSCITPAGNACPSPTTTPRPPTIPRPTEPGRRRWTGPSGEGRT